jgi:hypothetical protein
MEIAGQSNDKAGRVRLRPNRVELPGLMANLVVEVRSSRFGRSLTLPGLMANLVVAVGSNRFGRSLTLPGSAARQKSNVIPP